MTLQERLEMNDVSKEICIINEEAFVESLIGISEDDRAVYDYDKMVEEFAKAYNLPIEEAEDYVDYNVVRFLSMYGENPPIVVYPLRF